MEKIQKRKKKVSSIISASKINKKEKQNIQVEKKIEDSKKSKALLKKYVGHI